MYRPDTNPHPFPHIPKSDLNDQINIQNNQAIIDPKGYSFHKLDQLAEYVSYSLRQDRSKMHDTSSSKKFQAQNYNKNCK